MFEELLNKIFSYNFILYHGILKDGSKFEVSLCFFLLKYQLKGNLSSLKITFSNIYEIYEYNYKKYKH